MSWKFAEWKWRDFLGVQDKRKHERWNYCNLKSDVESKLDDDKRIARAAASTAVLVESTSPHTTRSNQLRLYGITIPSTITATSFNSIDILTPQHSCYSLGAPLLQFSHQYNPLQRDSRQPTPWDKFEWSTVVKTSRECFDAKQNQPVSPFQILSVGKESPLEHQMLFETPSFQTVLSYEKSAQDRPNLIINTFRVNSVDNRVLSEDSCSPHNRHFRLVSTVQNERQNSRALIKSSSRTQSESSLGLDGITNVSSTSPCSSVQIAGSKFILCSREPFISDLWGTSLDSQCESECPSTISPYNSRSLLLKGWNIMQEHLKIHCYDCEDLRRVTPLRQVYPDYETAHSTIRRQSPIVRSPLISGNLDKAPYLYRSHISDREGPEDEKFSFPFESTTEWYLHCDDAPADSNSVWKQLVENPPTRVPQRRPIGENGSDSSYQESEVAQENQETQEDAKIRWALRDTIQRIVDIYGNNMPVCEETDLPGEDLIYDDAESITSFPQYKHHVVKAIGEYEDADYGLIIVPEAVGRSMASPSSLPSIICGEGIPTSDDVVNIHRRASTLSSTYPKPSKDYVDLGFYPGSEIGRHQNLQSAITSSRFTTFSPTTHRSSYSFCCSDAEAKYGDNESQSEYQSCTSYISMSRQNILVCDRTGSEVCLQEDNHGDPRRNSGTASVIEISQLPLEVYNSHLRTRKSSSLLSRLDAVSNWDPLQGFFHSRSWNQTLHSKEQLLLPSLFKDTLKSVNYNDNNRLTSRVQEDSRSWATTSLFSESATSLGLAVQPTKSYFHTSQLFGSDSLSSAFPSSSLLPLNEMKLQSEHIKSRHESHNLYRTANVPLEKEREENLWKSPACGTSTSVDDNQFIKKHDPTMILFMKKSKKVRPKGAKNAVAVALSDSFPCTQSDKEEKLVPEESHAVTHFKPHTTSPNLYRTELRRAVQNTDPDNIADVSEFLRKTRCLEQHSSNPNQYCSVRFVDGDEIRINPGSNLNQALRDAGKESIRTFAEFQRRVHGHKFINLQDDKSRKKELHHRIPDGASLGTIESALADVEVDVINSGEIRMNPELRSIQGFLPRKLRSRAYVDLDDKYTTSSWTDLTSVPDSLKPVSSRHMHTNPSTRAALPCMNHVADDECPQFPLREDQLTINFPGRDRLRYERLQQLRNGTWMEEAWCFRHERWEFSHIFELGKRPATSEEISRQRQVARFLLALAVIFFPIGGCVVLRDMKEDKRAAPYLMRAFGSLRCDWVHPDDRRVAGSLLVVLGCLTAALCVAALGYACYHIVMAFSN